MDRQAERYFKQIEDLGGVIPAIEASFFQKEIADSAFRYQSELEQKRRIVTASTTSPWMKRCRSTSFASTRSWKANRSPESARWQEARPARCSNALTSLRKAAAGTTT